MVSGRKKPWGIVSRCLIEWGEFAVYSDPREVQSDETPLFSLSNTAHLRPREWWERHSPSSTFPLLFRWPAAIAESDCTLLGVLCTTAVEMAAWSLSRFFHDGKATSDKHLQRHCSTFYCWLSLAITDNYFCFHFALPQKGNKSICLLWHFLDPPKKRFKFLLFWGGRGCRLFPLPDCSICQFDLTKIKFINWIEACIWGGAPLCLAAKVLVFFLCHPTSWRTIWRNGIAHRSFATSICVKGYG